MRLLNNDETRETRLDNDEPMSLIMLTPPTPLAFVLGVYNSPLLEYPNLYRHIYSSWVGPSTSKSTLLKVLGLWEKMIEWIWNLKPSTFELYQFPASTLLARETSWFPIEGFCNGTSERIHPGMLHAFQSELYVSKLGAAVVPLQNCAISYP
ncbi:hypothetical protein J6590_049522 [Homalodisca vitripennis]|nr:hypothetical protein J6590_049522 [Homalodisca vitripennis]